MSIEIDSSVINAIIPESENLHKSRVLLLTAFGSLFDRMEANNPQYNPSWTVNTAFYEAQCDMLRAEVSRLNTILGIRSGEFHGQCIENIHEILFNSHSDTMQSILLLEIMGMLKCIARKCALSEHSYPVSQMLNGLAANTDFSHLPTTHSSIISDAFPASAAQLPYRDLALHIPPANDLPLSPTANISEHRRGQSTTPRSRLQTSTSTSSPVIQTQTQTPSQQEPFLPLWTQSQIASEPVQGKTVRQMYEQLRQSQRMQMDAEDRDKKKKMRLYNEVEEDKRSIVQPSPLEARSLSTQSTSDGTDDNFDNALLTCPNCRHRMEAKIRVPEDRVGTRTNRARHKSAQSYQDIAASQARQAHAMNASLGVTLNLLSQQVFCKELMNTRLSYDAALFTIKSTYKRVHMRRCLPIGWNDSIIYTNTMIPLLPPHILAIVAATSTEEVPTVSPTLRLPRVTSINSNQRIVINPNRDANETSTTSSSSSTSSPYSSSTSLASARFQTIYFDHCQRPSPFFVPPRLSLLSQSSSVKRPNAVHIDGHISYPLTTSHLFEVKKIDNPKHPCHGQHGLFARVTIGGDDPNGQEYYKSTGKSSIPERLGVHIADYTGILTYETERQSKAAPPSQMPISQHLFHKRRLKSMYSMTFLESKDLSMFTDVNEDDVGVDSDCDEESLSEQGILRKGSEFEVIIDATEAGNETRYINHYKQIAPTPNVQFMFYRCPYNHEIRMGVFLLRRIDAGSEVLVDYGDNFVWK